MGHKHDMATADNRVRRELAQQLRWLFGGRVTNDQFDEFYWDHCIDSDDSAVREIGRWAWAHCSDTSTYRLRGRDAPNPETRSSVVRAIVFLRSGAEYQWPSLREPARVELLRHLGGVWLAPTMVCLLLSLWNYGITVGGVMLGPLFLIGTAVLGAACQAAGRAAERVMRPRVDAFEAAGELNCWPYLNAEQLAIARQSGHVRAP